ESAEHAEVFHAERLTVRKRASQAHSGKQGRRKPVSLQSAPRSVSTVGQKRPVAAIRRCFDDIMRVRRRFAKPKRIREIDERREAVADSSDRSALRKSEFRTTLFQSGVLAFAVQRGGFQQIPHGARIKRSK